MRKRNNMKKRVAVAAQQLRWVAPSYCRSSKCTTFHAACTFASTLLTGVSVER